MKPIADRILRALEGLTARPPTHPGAQRILIPDPSVAVATDGHALILVVSTNPHGIPVGLHDPVKALAYLRAGATMLPDPSAPPFPAWEHAIPAPRTAGITPPLVAFDPALFLRVGNALKILGCSGQAAIWQLPTSPDDPLRGDAFADDLTATVVIMPMRIGEAGNVKKIDGRI